MNTMQHFSGNGSLYSIKEHIMKFLGFILLLVWTTGSGQSVVERSRKLYEEKKYAEAAKSLGSVEEEDKDFAEAQYYLGRIAFDQKEFDDAADFFQEAVEAKNGQVADYYNWLGNTYGTIAQDANLIRQGLLAPKMKSAWEKAIVLDPKNLDARNSLISYYTQAPSIMGGSMEKAKEMSRQIGTINPVQGHRTMGNLLVQEKKFDEAEREYVAMATAEPSLTPVLGNFYMNQKKFDKAFVLFEEVLKKNPQNMVAAYQIGKASAISGQRLDFGEQCLNRYLGYIPGRNEPSHGGANMRLAQIYEKKGNKVEAKQFYETALKIDNTLQEAKDGLVRVSK
jgi:tetratricopeptide (TPR) repeat protein